MLAICWGSTFRPDAPGKFPQFRVLVDPSGPGARPACLRPLLGGERAVVPGVPRPDAGVAVAPDLPADRRRATAQLGCDRSDGSLLMPQVSDAYALLLRQIAGRNRRSASDSLVPARMRQELTPNADQRLHRCSHRQPARLRGPHALTAPADPLLSCSTVDADDATGFSDAHALVYQFEKPLLDLGGTLLPFGPPGSAAAVLHRLPGRRVLRR